VIYGQRLFGVSAALGGRYVTIRLPFMPVVHCVFITVPVHETARYKGAYQGHQLHLSCSKRKGYMAQWRELTARLVRVRDHQEPHP